MRNNLFSNRRFAMLGLVAAYVGWFTACAGTSAAPPAAAPAVPVVAATVKQKDVPLRIHAIGAVEAYSTVSVKTQITGELTGVHFKEGDDVRQGQLIFSLDQRPYQAALNQAESNLAKDQAAAAMARVQEKRYQELVKEGVVSKEQYDQMESAAQASDAAVAADKAAVENAKVQLIYCSIYSPINGKTGPILLHQGNMIKANDTPALVNINQVEPIYVTFTVPQQYLAEVKQYASAGALPVEAVIPDDRRGPVTGKLSFIDNQVDSTTGTIKLKGVFENRDRRLWPGQFVDAYLRLKTQANAVVIPSQAIQNGQQGQFVFVIKDDNTVEARTVTVSEAERGEVVVQKGLAPGERIVTDGQMRLIPGSKVQIKG